MLLRPSAEDQATGILHEVKGKIKEKVGKAMNVADLQASGKAEKKAGRVQTLIGRVEGAVGE